MNIERAIQLAEAIAAMYRGDLPATNGANGTDTQYRVEEPHPGDFVVIFPGTASLRDFRTDAKILKTAWLGEGVASGIPAWDAAGAGLAGGGSALTGAATSGLGSVLSGIDPTLLQLGGAALGALSSGDQEQKQTGTREPWGPAQDWIKSNITRGQELQKRYEQTPFSPQQATAYQNLYGTINAANQMAPGLLGNFNQQMTQGYDRFAPKESRGRPTFSPLTAAWNPGLLNWGG
jgi:hypothetical protein